MPIITPNKEAVIKVSGKIFTEQLHQEIEQYMAWSGFKDIKDFIRKASEKVLADDRDWQKARKHSEQVLPHKKETAS